MQGAKEGLEEEGSEYDCQRVTQGISVDGSILYQDSDQHQSTRIYTYDKMAKN